MTVAQHKEREEVKQKLQIYSAKKLWVETLAGEAKVAQLKPQVKKAKNQSDKLKEQHNQLVQAQEQIQRTKVSLREACLEKVEANCLFRFQLLDFRIFCRRVH